jgi:lipopolysaccharide/colanic/teichoic acid biosynthesis glycosyltransferase
MITSIIPSLQNNSTVPQHEQNDLSPSCRLQWRRGQLLVKLPGEVKQPYLPSLDSEQLLVECLKHSPANLVSIDAKLGENLLKFWADACEEANKPLFLRISSSNKLLKSSSQSGKKLQQLIEWLMALVLLILVSPIMLGIMILMRVDSPGNLFSYEWRVGEQGKVFRVIKFCTNTKDNLSPFKSWMRKFGLDNLPQLFNVLRGEMRLLKSRCLSLADAVNLSLTAQKQQKKLAIINKSWEVAADSNLLHLDSQTL